MLTEAIMELLEKLESSPKRQKNAPHVSALAVRDILENGEIHFTHEQPMHPAYPTKLATIVTPDREVHTVQVRIDPARGLYFHFCLKCGGYCNAAAAALIDQLVARSQPVDICPYCGVPSYDRILDDEM